MPIEYIPPGLGFAIKDPYKQRGLKNRDGVTAAFNESGEKIGDFGDEGPLLEMHKLALDYAEQNPSHTVVLAEFSCTGNMVVDGDRLQILQSRE